MWYFFCESNIVSMEHLEELIPLIKKAGIKYHKEAAENTIFVTRKDPYDPSKILLTLKIYFNDFEVQGDLVGVGQTLQGVPALVAIQSYRARLIIYRDLFFKESEGS